jgi:MraZ protein
MKEWEKMMIKINGLNRLLRKIDFIRRFTAGVKVVEIDSWQIVVTKDLTGFTQIKRRCAIFCS